MSAIAILNRKELPLSCLGQVNLSEWSEATRLNYATGRLLHPIAQSVGWSPADILKSELAKLKG